MSEKFKMAPQCNAVALSQLVLLINLILLIRPSIASIGPQSRCEFRLRIDGEAGFECLVHELKGPRKAYPELHEFLSDHRPVYLCWKGKQKHLLEHRGQGWHLERVREEDESIQERVASLPSWAVSPLTMETSTPKLNGRVQVQSCRDKTPSIFHLTDPRIYKGFTSFYVKIATDPAVGLDVFYGVSSRYFGWRSNGIWYFSAHWKNVGGMDYARLQCEVDEAQEGLPRGESCVRLGDDGNTWTQVSVKIVCGEPEINTHQALISYRNRQRKVRSKHEYTLLNGLRVPLVGLGTGAMERSLTKSTLKVAKKLGYALIDTAAKYDNENLVAEVFADTATTGPIIETKVWPTELGYQRTIKSVMLSRENLKLPVIDMVLLHWPRCNAQWNVDWMDCSTADPDEDGTLWLESWRALERLYAEGFVLSIGVSNFNRGLLEIAEEEAQSTIPMVVQNDFDFGNLDLDVIQYCRSKGILYQGYGIFRNPFSDVQEQILLEAMKKDGYDNPDVLAHAMRVLIKGGVGFLRRSNNRIHLEANLRSAEQPLHQVTQDVFDLFAPSNWKERASTDEL